MTRIFFHDIIEDVSIQNGTSKIVIPSNYKGRPVTAIVEAPFPSNRNLIKSIMIPNSVTSIEAWAFDGCTGLTNITVAEGNSVYHSAENCIIETASKTLVVGCKTSIIPTDGSVTSIGNYAFRGCTGLTSVTIPDNVTSIGSSAFSRCSSLTSITFQGTKTQWNAISKGSSWNYNTGNYTITCADGTISK